MSSVRSVRYPFAILGAANCYNRPMRHTKPILGILLGAVALVGSVRSGTAAGEERAPLSVVDSEFVCMVNDASYDRPQVPVDVDGKTYFGCCEMCKARLADDPALRVAIDPVSGKEIDKAEAIIASDAYDRVFYFESEETLKKANKKLAEHE